MALKCLITWFEQENEKKKKKTQQKNQDRPSFKIFCIRFVLLSRHLQLADTRKWQL